jgi:hypothetical protein
MVCFQTKNPNLGKFWRVLQWKILVYLMTIWSILRPLKKCYGHLVYFAVVWYISPRLGNSYQEKSGNPGCQVKDNIRLLGTISSGRIVSGRIVQTPKNITLTPLPGGRQPDGVPGRPRRRRWSARGSST